MHSSLCCWILKSYGVVKREGERICQGDGDPEDEDEECEEEDGGRRRQREKGERGKSMCREEKDGSVGVCGSDNGSWGCRDGSGWSWRGGGGSCGGAHADGSAAETNEYGGEERRR